jgi:hypothetical protein
MAFCINKIQKQDAPIGIVNFPAINMQNDFK